MTTPRWLAVCVIASLLLAMLYVIAWRQANGLNP